MPERIELSDYPEFIRGLECSYDDAMTRVNPKMLRLMHLAVCGLAGETGEIIDNIKRHIFYGKELDVPNLKEELCDLLFFLVGAMDCVDMTLDDALQMNYRKLRTRYKDGKFSQDAAINRDLEAEKSAMEKNENN